MEKSKIWIKDKYKRNSFCEGEKVILIRRKCNGHPKTIQYNVVYIIDYVEGDILHFKSPTSPKLKCHYSYFLKVEDYRDEALKELLDL